MRLLPLLAVLAVAAAQEATDSDPDAARAAAIRATRMREEMAVRVMAFRTAEHYRRREVALRECRCSIHFCGYAFGEDARCMPFPLKQGDLGCQNEDPGRDCKEERVSYIDSFVRTPPAVDITNIAAHPTVAEDICITQMLDDEKIFHRATYPEVCEDFKGWGFISSPSGAFRIWPGVPARAGGEDCPEFDPRKRPWYHAAIRGPLNAVIVLDRTGPAANWDITRETAKELLNRFSYLDFVNFIVFTDEATSLGGDLLSIASIDARSKIEKALDNINPAGGDTVVDYGAALAKAFDVFNRTAGVEQDGGGPGTLDGCQKVIVFMSHSSDCSEALSSDAKCSVNEDGVSSEGGGRAKLLNNIQALQSKLPTPAALFTYSVGTEVDPGLMQQMACQNGGVSSQIKDDSQASLKILEPLFDFAALGPVSEDPFWSEPYLDAFGLGIVVSITLPVFLQRGIDGAPPLCFLGLAGHDVQLEEITSEFPIDDLAATLVESRDCLPIVGGINACKLQSLRGEHAQCQARLPSSKCHEFTTTVGKPSLYTLSKGTTNGESPQFLDFNAADSYCSNKGGHLAVVDSLETQQFLAGIAPPDRSWIGLKRDDESNDWVWVNGTVADSETLSRLWHSGQVVGDEAGERRCAALDPGSTSRNVRALRCDERLNFICQFDGTAADCEGVTLPLTYENLTKTHDAQDDRLKCQLPDECGFSEQPPKGDAICSLGERSDYECCSC